MKEIKISDHFTYSRMIRFAMPTIGMILISITYDVIDGYFISNYIGKPAFSAVNIIYPFQLLLSLVVYMFGSGGSALIAAELGNGRQDKANQYFTIIIRTCFRVSLVLMIVGILALPWISGLLGATTEIMEYGTPYGRTLFLFLPVMTLGYAFQSLLITAEKPKVGFYISIGNLVSNLIYDYLFVAVFHWGMIGVAAYGVVIFVEGIFAAVFYGLAMESTSVVGYHYGAKNYPELKNLLKKGIVPNLESGVVMCLLCRLLAPVIAGM